MISEKTGVTTFLEKAPKEPNSLEFNNQAKRLDFDSDDATMYISLLLFAILTMRFTQHLHFRVKINCYFFYD